MDGPTSRLPSTVTNPDLTLAHAVTARQSLRELYSSAPTTPSSYIDPPRPAKEGYEWVWFPGGYWAEREVVESPGKEFMKAFKWRKHSGKGSSSRETTTNTNLQGSREQSPSNSHEQQQQQLPKMPLPSPFLTEEAHVQSLQRPSVSRNAHSSESVSSLWLNRLPKPPLPSPYLTEEAHVQSLQRPPIPRRNTNSSESWTPMFKSSRTLASSPLTLAKEESDLETPTPAPTDEPSDSPATALMTPTSDGETKPKRSLINRLLSPDSKTPKLKPKKPSPVGSSGGDGGGGDDSYTATTIEGARSQLSQQFRPHTPMSRVASLLREESRKPPRKQHSMRLFGKSPWHHRKASGGSETSISSSIRDILRGRTPVASPASEIEGPCFDVAPCNTWSEQFPGGEAIRVRTPPLRQGAADQRPRSFFFDISTPTPRGYYRGQPPQSPPSDSNESGHSHTPGEHRHRREHDHHLDVVHGQDDTDTPKPKTKKKAKTTAPSSSTSTSTVTAATATTTTTKTTTTKMKKNRTKESCKEWWEVPPPPPHTVASQPSSSSSYEAGAVAAAATSFEFDVPEHLPSSPMCPANKRHRSGGTGVCVYHGRRKRSNGGGGGGGRKKTDNDDDDEDGGGDYFWT
ncbi:hypothetical protein F5X99DRAFT_424845 [Biscogniauxia marginata]|nr:hypothetical protein F5X99DRAFT_424845 [Biscogniauxia marginata]